jgi:hypothetical protein
MARSSSEPQANRGADTLSQSDATSRGPRPNRWRRQSPGGFGRWGEHAAQRGRAWETTHFGGVGKGRFGRHFGVCRFSWPRPLRRARRRGAAGLAFRSSAEGAAGGRERILDTVETLFCGCPAHFGAGRRRRRHGKAAHRKPTVSAAGAWRAAEACRRDSLVGSGASASRAVGGRQNSKRATAAVTRYGY